MGDSLCAKLLVLISVGNSYSPWHDCPSPVYPSLQVQMWEPSVLLQFELTWQTWLPSLHSLTSENKKELPKRYLTETNIKFLSFQRKSFVFICGKLHSAICKVLCDDYTVAWVSPVYPSLQVQMWEPSVLVQFAVTSQAWLLLRHSSISGSTYDIDRIIRAKSVFMVFTHEIVVSKVEGVNAANEWDFWYKATIVYIPYGLTICDVLGLLYSIHYIRRVNSSFIAFNCQTDNGL